MTRSLDPEQKWLARLKKQPDPQPLTGYLAWIWNCFLWLSHRRTRIDTGISFQEMESMFRLYELNELEKRDLLFFMLELDSAYLSRIGQKKERS